MPHSRVTGGGGRCAPRALGWSSIARMLELEGNVPLVRVATEKTFAWLVLEAVVVGSALRSAGLPVLLTGTPVNFAD